MERTALHRIVVFAAIALTLTIVGVQAQEVPQLRELSLEELLATKIDVASSKAQTIFTTPSTVSVIDRATIERFNITSVSEALTLIPGMTVLRTYLKRDIPTARGILQDHYANKVLVLLNGAPSWNAVTGEASIARVHINDVERIEVLKGPASALYGTNAYAAAINIVLREAADGSARARFRAGSAGRFEAGAAYGISDDGLSVFVAGNSEEEAGHQFYFMDEKGVGGLVDEYVRSSNATIQASYGRHSLLVNAFRSHESYLGVDPTFASGAGNDHVSDGVLGQYEYRRSLWDKVGFRYGLAFDWNRRNLSRSFDDNTRANLIGRRLTNTLFLDHAFDDAWSAEAGVEVDLRTAEEYKNYTVSTGAVVAENDMQDRTVNEMSFAAQVNYDRAPFSVTVGSRLTRNKLFGNNVSSRASAVYSIDDRNSVKLIWGQSYRAPALFELYFRTPTNTVFGNSGLKPETSTSTELAYLTSFGDVFIQALVYHSTYGNKIFRIRRLPLSPTDKSTIYANGSSFTSNGLEFEAKYQNPSVVNLFLNYSYVSRDQGDSVDGHYNFKYIPQHTVSAGAARSLFGIALSGIVRVQSEVTGPLATIDPSVTLDLSAGYTQTLKGRELRHSIVVKNALDAQEWFPEYVRRTINAVPSGYGRRISYELQVAL